MLSAVTRSVQIYRWPFHSIYLLFHQSRCPSRLYFSNNIKLANRCNGPAYHIYIVTISYHKTKNPPPYVAMSIGNYATSINVKTQT